MPAQPGSMSDWPTYHRDAARSGADPHAADASGRLTPAWKLPLDGQVLAEPLVVGGTVVAATENDSLYGIRDGRMLWHTRIGTPAPGSSLPCGDIDPLGIIGTPVYDAATGLIYAVAELTRPTRHLLVAVDPRTGVRRWSRSADPPGALPAYEQQRGALAVAGDRILVTYGGLDGDCGPYHGYVLGAAADGSGALAVYQTPSAREAGIWATPGPVSDGAGHLYVSVGNGAATAPPYDQSDSVLELAGTRVVSSFAPAGWAAENANDQDLGSQGPAVVGRYVFIAGKSGRAYTLRGGALGGVGGQVAERELCKSFGGTAVSGGQVFVPCTDGLRAVRIAAGGGMTVTWHAASGTTGSPVLGGGAVWALDPDGGVLHQLDPTTGASVASAPVGRANRFATPTLTGNLVLVGTLSGVTAIRTS